MTEYLLIALLFFVGESPASQPTAADNDFGYDTQSVPLPLREWLREHFGDCARAATTQQTGQAGTAVADPDEKLQRRVELTMLGSVDTLKGLEWALECDGKMAYSTRVAEPCDVTIFLDGAQLKVRTRPILIVSQRNGIITSIYAPPASQRATMREKVDEVYQILAEWNAQPNQRMREVLDECRERDYQGGSPNRIVPDIRAAFARLGERCTVTARFSTAQDGGWDIVLELQATAEEWERVRGK